jgi:hypothetical protein
MKLNTQPDSLSGQIIINFLDKLVFALVAGITLAIFQFFLTAHEESRQRKVAIQNFYSEVISEQRKILSSKFQQYLSLVEKYSSIGYISSENSKDREALSELTLSLDVLTLNASAISNFDIDASEEKIRPIMKERESFTKLIYFLTGKMLSQPGLNSKEWQEKKTEILDKYIKLLSAMNQSALNSVK